MAAENYESLPELELYAIPPEQAKRLSPLLTGEAQELIARGEAFSLCAVEDGEVCAAICAVLPEEQGETLELVSLYVAPSHRRRGVGMTLLLELIEDAFNLTEGELRRVEAVFDGSGDGLRELFEAADFELAPVADARSFRVSVSELASAPLMQLQTGAARAAVPFGDLASYRLRQLFLTLEQYGAEYVTFAELEQASPRLSFAVYGEDGELEACSVLGEQPGGFCLKQFFCRQTRLNAALTALRASAEALIARGPEDAVLEVPVVSDSAAQLARKLLAAAGTSGQLTRAVYLPG